MKKNNRRLAGVLLAMTLVLGSVSSAAAASADSSTDAAALQQAVDEAVDALTAADASAEAASPDDGNTGSTPSDNGSTAGSADSGSTSAAAGADSPGTTQTAGDTDNGSASDSSTVSGENGSTAGAADSSTADTQTDVPDQTDKAQDEEISGTVSTDSGSTDVSGTVTVEQDKDDDNVKIKKNDKPYLALGADLTEEQRATVLALMGVDAGQLDQYDVMYVNNSEEHQYLDSYIASSKIGTKSLSSVVIVERKDGNGINISTNNISYCTVDMYKNALATAGIKDADIIVAAPFPISGTAALVGIFKAYTQMTGDVVDEENIDAALNEIVVTGALKDAAGANADEVEGMIAYVKQQVVEHDMSDEAEIREVIAEACDKFEITLTEDEINQIIQLMQKINELDLDLDSILNAAQSIYDKIGSDSGFWSKIGDMFGSLLDLIKSWFR